MNENELRTRLAELLSEDKTDLNPGYISWDAYPAGWMRFKAWQRRSNRRRSEKRRIRRTLDKLQPTA